MPKKLVAKNFDLKRGFNEAHWFFISIRGTLMQI